MQTWTKPETRKARKPHRCEWCLEPIDAGATYTRVASVGPDGCWSMKLHPECNEAMLIGVRCCDHAHNDVDSCPCCDAWDWGQRRGMVRDGDDPDPVYLTPEQAARWADACDAWERDRRALRGHRPTAAQFVDTPTPQR